MDREALEVNIHTIQYDTTTDYPFDPINNTLPNTQIGGADHKSCVYVTVTFRGEVVDTEIVANSKDAFSGYWNTMALLNLEAGVKLIYYEVNTGTPVGSYLVEVLAPYWSDGVEYLGAAYYVIDCTSTTT